MEHWAKTGENGEFILTMFTRSSTSKILSEITQFIGHLSFPSQPES